MRAKLKAHHLQSCGGGPCTDQKGLLIVTLAAIPSASADCPILLNFVGRHSQWDTERSMCRVRYLDGQR